MNFKAEFSNFALIILCSSDRLCTKDLEVVFVGGSLKDAAYLNRPFQNCENSPASEV